MKLACQQMCVHHSRVDYLAREHQLLTIAAGALCVVKSSQVLLCNPRTGLLMRLVVEEQGGC